MKPEKAPQIDINSLIFSVLESCICRGNTLEEALQFHFKRLRVSHRPTRAATFEAVYYFLRDLRCIAGPGKESTLSPLRLKELLDKKTQNSKSAGTDVQRREQSLPSWFYRRGLADYGAEVWQEMLAAMDVPPPLYIRVNTLKTTPDRLSVLLAGEGVQVTRAEGNPNALCLNRDAEPFRKESYKHGFWEAQDISSQQVVHLMNLSPGMTVVDACAGTGGKTLAMAAAMQNKGKILALDVHTGRLDTLRKRLRRAGVNNAEVRHIDTSRVLKRLHQRADCLLLDVPCSGSGVLARNPDMRWKMQEHSFEELLSQQCFLLENYSLITKPGGTLVYATCSLFHDEGERQVEAFLAAHSNWSLIDQRRFGPGFSEGDGFYVARLQRK